MMTQAFSLAENGTDDRVLLAAVLVRAGRHGDGLIADVQRRRAVASSRSLRFSIAYVLAVLFLEPFYVAAGFGMYLNRRAELEAWDIEQEFRRAFARVDRRSRCSRGAVLVLLTAPARRRRGAAGKAGSARDRRPRSDRARARNGQGRSACWRPSGRSRSCLDDAPQPAGADPRWLAWIAGFLHAGSDSRLAMLVWAAAPCSLALLACLSSARVRAPSRIDGDGHIRRADARAAISTSVPRACRPTSAPPPASCGIAASSAPRWRCSIAACCRASRTCTSAHSGFQHRGRLPHARRPRSRRRAPATIIPARSRLAARHLRRTSVESDGGARAV